MLKIFSAELIAAFALARLSPCGHLVSSRVLGLHKILSPGKGKGNEISGTGDVLGEKNWGHKERGEEQWVI